MRILLPLLFLFAPPALAQVEVHGAWSRPTPTGAKIAAGYMVIENASAAPDKLVSASSPAAERVETHVTMKDGDVLRMREAKGYDIPARGRFELKPNGAHLMLVNIRAPFREGDRIPLTLRFQRAGEVKVELAVGKPSAMTEMHHHH